MLDQFIYPEQTAVKGRNLLSNVHDLLAEATNMCHKSDRVAILLLDFAAAFPSISRGFLFRALRASRIPENGIHAIGELYKDNRHFSALVIFLSMRLLLRVEFARGVP